ncbi:hypothetical protein DVH24_025908 [Malus domestica]|uniref:CCR4-Not complex component Not1 C-terminal domain-containing protein n=1 Tax=Malus domestica TaxID=3750 RepID=A0A498KM90_MALDO|nr:hypothetical protein DVH24_025908 [Malus domestica]
MGEFIYFNACFWIVFTSIKIELHLLTHEIIQEQITRVLLERLIVNRPHPWGLLITFIELIKNPRYQFWNRAFIRCAPEIEKLFESVSRSCGGPKPVDETIDQQNFRLNVSNNDGPAYHMPHMRSRDHFYKLNVDQLLGVQRLGDLDPRLTVRMRLSRLAM